MELVNLAGTSGDDELAAALMRHAMLIAECVHTIAPVDTAAL